MTEPKSHPEGRNKSWGVLGLLLTCPQAWSWWKLVSVHNSAFATCTRAQQKKPQTVDLFVPPNIACHKSSLILTCPKDPRTSIPSGSIQITSENDSISYASGTFKEQSQQGTETAGVNSTSSVSPCRGSFMLWLGSILIANQPEAQPHPWMGQEQPILNYNKRAYKELVSFSTVGMGLENIMLSKIYQAEKDKHQMILLICGI